MKLLLKDIPTIPEDMFPGNSGAYHMVPHPYTHNKKNERVLEKGWSIIGKSEKIEVTTSCLDWKLRLVKVLFEDPEGEKYFFHIDADYEDIFPFVIKEK